MDGKTKPTDGPKLKPGDNPNKLNARPRGIRPKTKNSSGGNIDQSMRLNWIDPLPQVNTIYPLGLEPNPEEIPAGEIELDPQLPETIAAPFASVINSVGQRIQMTEPQIEQASDALTAFSYFKSARQLYSTLQDHEKSENQPLKAVYYDETPIPLHMSGAIGIIGHMDTKIGQVIIQDAGVLFKRWIAKGLSYKVNFYDDNWTKFIWRGRDDFRCVQRVARQRIDDLTNQTYALRVDNQDLTVSMPKLIDQDLDEYHAQINDLVPNAFEIRRCVAALRMTYPQFRDGNDLPYDYPLADILTSTDLVDAVPIIDIPTMRDEFEDYVAFYTTDIKWRIESIFRVGPPPAGNTGYGAQTVQASGTNLARWQFPLSDADVNIGFLFSPAKSFTLHPRLVGYSKRRREAASAAFAQQDGKAFTQ